MAPGKWASSAAQYTMGYDEPRPLPRRYWTITGDRGEPEQWKAKRGVEDMSWQCNRQAEGAIVRFGFCCMCTRVGAALGKNHGPSGRTWRSAVGLCWGDLPPSLCNVRQAAPSHANGLQARALEFFGGSAMLYTNAIECGGFISREGVYIFEAN